MAADTELGLSSVGLAPLTRSRLDTVLRTLSPYPKSRKRYKRCRRPLARDLEVSLAAPNVGRRL